MKQTKWLVLLAVFAIIVVACGGDSTTTTAGDSGGTTTTAGEDMTVGAEFTIFGAPTGVELEALEGFVDIYNETTDSNITVIGSDGFEQELRIQVDGGNPPEVAFLPQPGSICTYADEGALVSLEDMGFESGDASGWPGTDWIEDILVRQSGSETYAGWFKHDIPFNDPAVAEAFDTFGEIMFGEGFVLGGAENVAGVNFNDSPGPLFTDPTPGCLMLKQGSFISNVFEQAPDFEEGEDAEISVFPFPTIGGNPGAMGGGDTIIVFDGADPTVQAIKDWITPDWQCTLASATGGGIAPHGGHGVAGVERLPGHKDVDPNCYDSDSAKAFAESVTAALAANTFVFDASDLMPPEVGQRSFWDGMVEWTRGTPTSDVVDTVEASWP